MFKIIKWKNLKLKTDLNPHIKICNLTHLTFYAIQPKIKDKVGFEPTALKML